jgi:Endonuclease NucS C-terminal domain
VGTEIKTWQIVEGALSPIASTLASEGRTEAYDLETWIASDPSVVRPGLLVIGRQISTKSGPLDLLAIDATGAAVIIELKRDRIPREALAQAVDYASDVAGWSLDKLSEVCAKYRGSTLDEAMAEAFPEIDIENVNVNEGQRIILVGFSVESSLERMIEWLSDSFGVGINAVILHYSRTQSGDELLTRTTIISEDVEEQRVRRKKFTIPMSDEPATLEEPELRTRLLAYLRSSLVSARRMRDILIPVCLEKGVAAREALKAELVARGEVEDPAKAGYHLTSISSQLGMAKNDFLRQVISYEYPTYDWEKDNYRVREEYRALVEDVLQELEASVQ